MLRSLCTFSFFAVLTALAPTAEAQRPGGGQGRGGSSGRTMNASALLGSEQVQKEIGLEGEKLEAVKEILEKSRAAAREAFSSFGNIRELEGDAREKAIADMRAKQQEASKGVAEKLNKHLTKEQQTRLDQIALQLQGARALEDEKVAAKLELKDEQQLEIIDINEETRQAQRKMMEGLREGGREGFAQMREKIEAQRKEIETKLLAVLTDAQKAQFNELKGKPFELDRRAMFSGQRGNRGNRGNRDGGEGNNRRQRPASDE